MQSAPNNPDIKPWSTEEAEMFYKDLLDRALKVIPEVGTAMVLGPMFIIRSPEENFALFKKAQDELRAKGIETFDQLPFVDYIIGHAPFDYKLKFDIFYKGLIHSGKITTCYLLPNWEQSEGTRSEVEYCKEAGVPVHEIKVA